MCMLSTILTEVTVAARASTCSWSFFRAVLASSRRPCSRGRGRMRATLRRPDGKDRHEPCGQHSPRYRLYERVPQ